MFLLRHHQHDKHKVVGALRLDKGRPQVDLFKAGFLFLRHCVFILGGLLCTWQKKLPDDQKFVASCDKLSYEGTTKKPSEHAQV